MSGTQFYPPPAGDYPVYGQDYHSPSPYQNHHNQRQSSPPYPQSAPYPEQFPGETRLYSPQRSLPSIQGHSESVRSGPSEQGWDPKKVWAEHNGGSDYNNPSEPMFGKSLNSLNEFGTLQRSEYGTTAQPGADGERGLGATVLGGGAGAFLGRKMAGEHKTLGTIGGLALGAIAANAFEHHEKEKKREHRDAREYDEGYEAGERRHSHSSRSREIEDDRDSYYRGERDREYQDDEYYRPHHHHHHNHHDDDYDDRRSSYDRDNYSRDGYDREDDRYSYRGDDRRSSRGDYRSDYRADYYDRRY